MRISLRVLAVSGMAFWVLGGCAGIRPRYHSVNRGESLAAVAARYGLSAAMLQKKNASYLAQGLKPGTKLYLPFEHRSDFNEDIEPAAHFARTVAAEASWYTWPVRGTLSSPFGFRKGRRHDGIDIAAPMGTSVKAARSGHVIYAGSQISGYGKMVILGHPDSHSTIYAHLSQIDVRKGQFVARNQRLGRVGKTGHANQPHLHFEVRDHQTPRDPLLYLQGQVAANIVRR